jgi:hypothetical protein
MGLPPYDSCEGIGQKEVVLKRYFVPSFPLRIGVTYYLANIIARLQMTKDPKPVGLNEVLFVYL